MATGLKGAWQAPQDFLNYGLSVSVVGAERDWIEGDGWVFGAFRLGIGG